jgi:hypothetical protein
MGNGEVGQVQAALGFRVKSGWAMAVVLAGDQAGPRVLERARVDLYDLSVPASGQPFHAGLDRPPAEAGRIVGELIALVEASAARSVAEFLARCTDRGFHLLGAGLVVGSVADPAAIANDHIRAHAEEGRLFRRVLEAPLRAAGLSVTVTVEKRLYLEASGLLRRPEADLRKEAAAFGKAVGGRWRAEEKAAALAAWMRLGASRQAP